MINIIELLFHLLGGHGVETTVPLVPFTQIEKVQYIACMVIVIRIITPLVITLIKKLKGAFNLW